MGRLVKPISPGYPKTHWTLLVQDVDKWDVDVAALLDEFSFLPAWRIDDIMVSYAVDGGGVGPHVDNYDVFLVQGRGQRRWRISTEAEAPADNSALMRTSGCCGASIRPTTGYSSPAIRCICRPASRTRAPRSATA